MQSYCFFLDYANIWEENRVFLVLFRAKRGDCTQGCVYFVYLYTLGAKKSPRIAARASFDYGNKKLRVW